jgi:hypothetical protein
LAWYFNSWLWGLATTIKLFNYLAQESLKGNYSR